MPPPSAPSLSSSPVPHFRTTKPRQSSDGFQKSPMSLSKKTQRPGGIIANAKHFFVASLVPLGSSPAFTPTSVLQLLVFHFYHTILIFLHMLLTILYLFLRNYHIAKNSFLAFLYHHHRTPQLIAQDIKNLAKTPRHVSIILTFHENEEGGGVEGLMEQVADVASWSIGAGVTELTVYERTGQLNKLHAATYAVINRTLQSYYGDVVPVVKLRTPHDNSVYPEAMALAPDLKINLISKPDGRGHLVELTRELAISASKGEFSSEKVTVDLIDKLTSQVITEPDLVVLFGPKLDLDGFPPWQVRLSEIYYAPYNHSVTYSVFLRGIRRYSSCKINVGR